jgi:alkanesulfonate monooxygenase SsuD/methylene tetrahydromethanopterin reductase-like flavin-dependent oxidoreductase (luciferase family)
MWSGRPYRHDGPHYQVSLDEAAAEPHPIPVWIASSASHPQVVRRAAACDGVFPNPADHTLTPDEIAGLLAAIRHAGLPAGRPFDVVAAGNASPAWPEPAKADLASLFRAGMTWWLESLIHFDPLELSLRIVDAGPPR